MKKYIAPEMEIAKFNAQDIITVSGGGNTEPAGAIVYNEANSNYSGFSEDATYGKF